MKTAFITSSILAVLSSCCAGEYVKYSSFVVDGISYSIIENTKKVEVYQIKEMMNEEGIVSIPQSVSFQNTVYTVIGIRPVAFFDCISLTGIYLPETLEYIGNGAFSGCNLKYIYCPAIVPPTIEKNTFDDTTYQNTPLYVPYPTIYKSEDGWSSFKNINEIE